MIKNKFIYNTKIHTANIHIEMSFSLNKAKKPTNR